MGIEKIRLNLLRLSFVILVGVALFLDAPLLDTGLGWTMRVFGILLIIAGVLGRFWAILYVGGKKNQTLVDDGPYSLCRHPLYLFSTIATFGFGFMLQSFGYALAFGLTTFVVLYLTGKSEEARLAEMFGEEWSKFAQGTPRILPKFSNFRAGEKTRTIRLDVLRTNFADGLVFLALIPVAEFINWLHVSGYFTVLRIW